MLQSYPKHRKHRQDVIFLSYTKVDLIHPEHSIIGFLLNKDANHIPSPFFFVFLTRYYELYSIR